MTPHLPALRARLAPATVLRAAEPLARRTTLRVGGPADFYAEPADETDLATLLVYAREHALPVTLLGRGSNLLVRDGGIRGLVVCLAQPGFARIELAAGKLHCGAGAKLKDVANAARRAGLAGLEFLEGIPGGIGGGLRMNAGALGGWMFQVVERVRFMDFSGQIFERAAAEIPVSYRHCALLHTHIALAATLTGRPDAPEAIAGRMKAGSTKRWETQPAQPSAGCIFKNPENIPAGKLIDELGLKGARRGAAMVSDVHGNFIVNLGGARAADVLELIAHIRATARAQRGIELRTEVEILGEAE